MDNRSIPDYSHGFLIHQLEKLGYRCDLEGVCYVLTQQGINAFLLGKKEFDYFSDRLDFIAISPDLHEQINQTLKKIIERGDGKLSVEEQTIIDIKIAFDQFVIFQFPYDYEELFGGRAVQQLQVLDYAYANNWKLFNDEIEKPDPEKMFSGIYTRDELQEYLEKLDDLLLHEDAPDRFVMELQQSNHTLALTHDRIDGWMLIDASKLPPKKQIIPKEKLAEELFEALGTRCGEVNTKYITFHTTIRSNKKESARNREVLKKLKESPEFQPPHHVTNELARRQTSTLGTSLTHIAAKYADYATLEALLKIKSISVANINNFANFTPLHTVALVGRPEVIEKLYQGGANLYARDMNGNTAFDLALQHGNTDNIKAFVKINPGFLKNIRWNLVEKTVSHNRFEMLKYLLEQTPSFKSQQEINIANELLVHAVGFEDIEAVKMLLSKGANPDIKNEWDTPLLHLAIHRENSEMIKALLDKGANPDVLSEEGYSPLWLATQEKNLEIVKLLLDKGASVDLPNEWGTTSLSVAATNNEFEIVFALLDKGADPYKPDSTGVAPLDEADENMVEKIKMHMTKINVSQNRFSYFQQKNIQNETSEKSPPVNFPKK